MSWPLATTRDAFLAFQAFYQEQSTRYFDPVKWAPQVMMEAVRDVRDEVSLLNPTLIGSKNTTVQYVFGQREYLLPSSFFQTIKVEVTDLTANTPSFPTLGPIDFTDIGGYLYGPFIPGVTGGDYGEPSVYYIRQLEIGDTPIGLQTPVTQSTTVIGFDPVPYRTAITQNVNVWSEWASAAISAVDLTTSPDPNPVLDLPINLMDLVPRHMCVQAAPVSDAGLGAIFASLYNSKLTKKLVIMANNKQSSPFQIQVHDTW